MGLLHCILEPIFIFMKKLFFIACIGALSTNTLHAQSKKSTVNKKTSQTQYVSLGPTFGIGHSWLSNLDDQTVKPSGHLGISLIYSRYEHWGWGVDLTASHEGFRMEAPDGTNMSVDPTYLRLTPKAYYFFGNFGDKCRPKLYAGPSMAYKIQEDHYYDGERIATDGVNNVWFAGNSDVFEELDLGITVGGGLNMRLAKSLWLNMDGSYYHGLAEVTSYNQMNRNLRFNLGLMFGL